MKRLENKVAIVVGAGQGPGTGMGNGRATVIRFAQEGAKVLCVDRDVASGAHAVSRWKRIDVLHYNVGFSIAGGDASPTEITEEAFDRVLTVNLRGMVMAVKHVLPIMRAQKSGVILGISSLAAWEKYPYVAYKASKSAMVAYCQQIAIQNAEHGIRCNVILPGLMDTPMAVDTRARHTNKPRAEIAAMRDARVPLRKKMGTAWDVANAALFLASDEANFITGVQLPVDGGSLVDIGH
jgi:NAD(P)-dependent dehydrogenase (short-subunit alcohol dehydrogenase family)